MWQYATISAFLSMFAAIPAILLTLSCKHHPVSRAVIIPGAPADGKSPAVAPLERDFATKAQVFKTVLFALLAAAFLVLLLWETSRASAAGGNTGTVSGAMSGTATPDITSINLLTFAQVCVYAGLVVPGVLTSYTWMTNKRAFAIAIVVVLVVLSWYSIDSWITIDLLAAGFTIVVVSLFQSSMSFMRLSVIFTILAVAYDAVTVYATGDMVKTANAAVPVVGAQERILKIPQLFMLPDQLSLHPASYGFIGVGDIVIFSLLALTAARFGKKVGSRTPLYLALAGFVVAVYACSLVVNYFRYPQPATIFIVPCCALPVILYGLRRKLLVELTTRVYASEQAKLRQALRKLLNKLRKRQPEPEPAPSVTK